MKLRAADLPDRTSYAAVVLYYKLGPRFERTLSALLEVDEAPMEIVIVDNSPEDAVAEAAARAIGASYVGIPENLGYAGGMNAGFEAIRGDPSRVLFMTHEVLLAPGAPTALIDSMDGQTGIAGPILQREGDRNIWSTGGRIDRLGRAQHDTRIPSSTTTVDWLDGACLMVNNAAFRGIGGFDERYFLYWEDVDLSLRMRRAGWTVQIAPAAAASQETALVPAYYQARNHVRLWILHRRPFKALLAVLVATYKVVDSIRDDRATAMARLRGLRDGLTGGRDARPAR